MFFVELGSQETANHLLHQISVNEYIERRKNVAKKLFQVTIKKQQQNAAYLATSICFEDILRHCNPELKKMFFKKPETPKSWL